MSAVPANSAGPAPLMKNSTFSWLARLFGTTLLSPENYIKEISAQPGVSERTAGTDQGSAALPQLGDLVHDLPSTTPFVLEGKCMEVLSTSVINIKQRLHLCDYTIGVRWRGQSSSDGSIRTGTRSPGAMVTTSVSLRRLVDCIPPRCGSFRSSHC